LLDNYTEFKLEDFKSHIAPSSNLKRLLAEKKYAIYDPYLTAGHIIYYKNQRYLFLGTSISEDLRKVSIDEIQKMTSQICSIFESKEHLADVFPSKCRPKAFLTSIKHKKREDSQYMYLGYLFPKDIKIHHLDIKMIR
jgi:hypothetical protein